MTARRGIGQLPVGQALLLAENCPPIIARQRALFEDRRTWKLIRAEQAAAAATASSSTAGAKEVR